MRIAGWIGSFAMLVATGCTGNYQSIYRHQPLDDSKSSITAIDAKQRAIIVAKTGGKGHKFCAEPSPDVFSVVAQAISAGGTFGRSADPKVVEAALSAAFSSSEQGSTIPRTQTINMLRELMYRTCERWLNNQLSDAEMPIQAARDQRLMVSILAIEQLTGAVTSKPVVIGSASSASTGMSGADAVVRIDDAFKALNAKTAAEVARQKDFDELNTGTNSCDALAKKVEAKEALDDVQTQANEKCNNARTALARAKLERGSAAAHHQHLLDTSRVGGIPASATSSADSRQAGGGIDRAHTSDVQNVAAVVKDIVDLNFKQDEFLLFCLKVLSAGGEGRDAAAVLRKDEDTKTACINHVKTSIELETARLNFSATRLQEAMTRIGRATDEAFEQFWERIRNANGTGVDEETLKDILRRARILKSEIAELEGKRTKEEVRAWFQTLAAGSRDALATGGEE